MIINVLTPLMSFMEKLLPYYNTSAMSDDQGKTLDEQHHFMNNVNDSSDDIHARATATNALLHELLNKKRKYNDI